VLFLSGMANTGTYVRLLRHLGIALIFAPEPFTTPFGVACMLAARHLSKRNEASVNYRLREMVQYYLAHASRFTDHPNGEASAPAPVKRRNLRKEHAILGRITGSRVSQANCPVRQAKRDIQDGRPSRTASMQSLSRRCKYADDPSCTSIGAQKVTHHSVNMERLSRRHQYGNDAVAHSTWATTCGAVEGITRHSANMSLLPRNSTTGSFGQTEAKCHTINTALLRQRYGSTAGHTTFLKALQTNNHYYSMLSRGNVVGGY
jgi:hypothetical protein